MSSIAAYTATDDTNPLVRPVLAIVRLLDRWAAPVFDLAIRLWLAKVFFAAGLTKLRSWDSTLYLFREEYQVPLLPVPLAAFMGTAVELVCPVLLVAGLATRFASVPMLGTTLMIQFVLGARSPDYDSWEHFVWMTILLSLIAKGAGRFSLDYLIRRRFEAGR
jgi:putative oxidoreductase